MLHRRFPFAPIAAALSLAAVPVAVALAQGDGADAAARVSRGQRLFTEVYKCYACHGYDAQTGERRLRPLNYTPDGFVAFVQNSPLPQMPAYRDVPDADLAEIYAYIQSIPVDAPSLADVPILQSILERKLEALTD